MRKNLYLLRGKEGFLKELFVRRRRERYSSVNIVRGGELGLKEFVGILSDRGVFGGDCPRMVVVKHAEALPLSSKTEVSFVLSCLSDCVDLFLVFEEDNKVYALFRGAGKEFTFSRLYGGRLQEWVEGLLRDYGIKPHYRLVDALVSLQEPPLIYDKVQQISLLASDGILNEKDVEELFSSVEVVNPFAVIDAVLNKDLALMMRVIYSAKTKEDSLKAFYTVVKYVHALFIAKLLAERGRDVQQELVSLLKLHPFVAKKVLRALSLYPLDFFAKKIPYLYSVEVRLRKSHLDLRDSIAKGLFYLFSDAS